MKETGKVYLVGAGPGDAGLLTRKGYELLMQADVVCYDSLVGDSILAMIPERARLINVGKRSSNHTMPQEKMNVLLLEEAQKGNTVVRLKGGDPFLFGRGGEELELLADNGVPFEVVPGITSSIAVPAYNGIPVTHRDFTSSLHIITGHKRAGQKLDLNFDALVRVDGTLVFLMGVAALHDICEGLMGAGMDTQMPAAILQKGTTAGQKRIVATVATIEEEVERQGIETPAIIVVGKVCALADRFAWYEKLPLAGTKVLVTRPRDRRSTLSEKLRAKGAEVLEIPSIETVPAEDLSLLDDAIAHMELYQWIAFTSPYGVRVFFDRMNEKNMDIRRLYGVSVAAIGEGTKAELRNRGVIADLVPEIYDGQSLGAAIAKAAKEGDRILLPRAKIGNRAILDELSAFAVDDLPIYETVYRNETILDETALFENGEISCAVFTSTSTVDAFAAANPSLDMSKVRAMCIGKQTEEAARRYSMQTETAQKATIDSLVALVESIFAE
ncbi:MAG: uroporphyrinogen-III C-methyltransferase [Eubacteriales bacterium]|nr:uroporphyrinogen-III C-methyltransferase [Eubacteriales bacterium]